MKIEAEVLGVKTDGISLSLSLSGWPVTAPEGEMATSYTIDVPATTKAKRAFYIGRKVSISIDPQ